MAQETFPFQYICDDSTCVAPTLAHWKIRLSSTIPPPKSLYSYFLFIFKYLSQIFSPLFVHLSSHSPYSAPPYPLNELFVFYTSVFGVLKTLEFL
jgi:hypothetical protein